MGRTNDLVQLPSGALASATGLMRKALRESPEVDQYRIVQTDTRSLTIELVCRVDPPPERIAAIEAEAMDYLDEPMRLDFRQVAAIERSPSGKPRHFVSKLAEN